MAGLLDTGAVIAGVRSVAPCDREPLSNAARAALRAKLVTPTNRPEEHYFPMSVALDRGFRGLRRPLTSMERLVLCLMRVPPTHRLDVSVQSPSPGGIGSQWNHFLRDFNENTSDSPAIYIAVLPRSIEGNDHVHAFLWTYPNAASAIGAAKKSGFGSPKLTSLKDRDTFGRLRDLSYVLGQHERVFGTDNHLENEPLATSRRAFVRNQGATIRSRTPDLFHALKDWKDQSVSDISLMDRIPKSSKR